MMNYENAALFEHRFWLQILGDHARFIHSALAPKEVREIQQAQYFINVMDSLLNRARQDLSTPEILALSQQASEEAQRIREFKLSLIRQHLVGEIDIGLTPTFINHMVNEVEEYIRILNCLVQQEVPPPLNPVHHHLLWLLDAVGHASAITADLDDIEKNLMEKSLAFMRQFEDYYMKAVEFSGYLRTCLPDFPALTRFNRQVDKDMTHFREFLRRVEALIISNEALGRLTPLVPDHMAREECYYLIKLAQVSTVKMPDCDPTEPRTNA